MNTLSLLYMKENTLERKIDKLDVVEMR